MIGIDTATMRSTASVLTVASMMLLANPARAADVASELEQTEAVSTFVAAMALSGLDQELRQDGPYTVFVPTNDALDAEGSATLLDGVYRTPANRARLVDLVGYHIVPGEAVDATTPAARASLTALNGEAIELEGGIARTMINGHIEIIASTTVDNGVIHMVSGLLSPLRWPDEAAATPDQTARLD